VHSDISCKSDYVNTALLAYVEHVFVRYLWLSISVSRVIQVVITELNTRAKAVPLHATKGLGRRGGTAPAHSRPQH
jgi:hypothetical protein